ncbi:MAG: hypothetical protein LBU90_03845 [Bacteroidales bacterium]|nr:hypothetical protein [Bacteroidales bacterium]
MNFFQEHIGRYLLKLRSKHTQRKLHVNNFETAHSIAIMYHETSKTQAQKVMQFAQYIAHTYAETSISIMAFRALNKGKQVYKTEDFSKTIITQNDFSWYGTAKSATLEKFIQTPFDILIDLSMEEIFPLQYILQLSHASFKIGKLNSTLHYDFMIDVKNEKNIDFLIQQISVYLPSLKQK